MTSTDFRRSRANQDNPLIPISPQFRAMAQIVNISEEAVAKLLDWDLTFKTVEVALESVRKKCTVQSPRSFTKCTKTLLLTMPGYLDNEDFGALGCKLVTITPDNANLKKPLPTISAYIMLFDAETGALKAMVAGSEITKWRTAAASAVATKHLLSSEKQDVLAILGAGVQGEAHAASFNHFFQFKEIRIWNHHETRAQQLVTDLNGLYKTSKFKCVQSNRECVRNADCIVTATYAKEPILQLEWLKEGVHINAVGTGVTHHSELSESIYLNSEVYIDHWAGAETELAGLKELGVEFKGEIGGLVTGEVEPTAPNGISVFQSLGMAVEDCAMARMIYDIFIKQRN